MFSNQVFYCKPCGSASAPIAMAKRAIPIARNEMNLAPNCTVPAAASDSAARQLRMPAHPSSSQIF